MENICKKFQKNTFCKYHFKKDLIWGIVPVRAKIYDSNSSEFPHPVINLEEYIPSISEDVRICYKDFTVMPLEQKIVELSNQDCYFYVRNLNFESPEILYGGKDLERLTEFVVGKVIVVDYESWMIWSFIFFLVFLYFLWKHWNEKNERTKITVDNQ